MVRTGQRTGAFYIKLSYQNVSIVHSVHAYSERSWCQGLERVRADQWIPYLENEICQILRSKFQ
jgi:hypothetical protein